MAVDTRNKRMSMMGFMNPIRRFFQNPSGTIDAAAREMLLFLYSGFGVPPPAVSNPVRMIRALSRSGTAIDAVSRT